MKYFPIDNSLFIKNRKKFIDKMEDNSIAFFNSNDNYPVSADTTLPFEQHRDLLKWKSHITKFFWAILTSLGAIGTWLLSKYFG